MVEFRVVIFHPQISIPLLGSISLDDVDASPTGPGGDDDGVDAAINITLDGVCSASDGLMSGAIAADAARNEPSP